MPTITVRVSEEEKKLMSEFAQFKGKNLSEFIKKSALEEIEAEIDLKSYHAAMDELKKDNTTYTMSEVKKELGL